MQSSLIHRIIHLYTKPARVAILMSGNGTNADKILESSFRYPNLNFITLFTDRADSNALQISKKYKLEYHCLTKTIQSPDDRNNYFLSLAEYLNHLKIDTLIYAGFMKISPDFFVKQFPGINVHPADLRIIDRSGKPKYIGMNSILDAINAGENYIASTAHVVDAEVDCGLPMVVSRHFSLNGIKNQDIASLHEKLKVNCEHHLYPLVLELLSQGRLFIREMPYQWDDLLNKLKIDKNQYFCQKLINQIDNTTTLDMAYLAQDYASQVNFDFSDIEQVFDKVKEEFDELTKAFQDRHQNRKNFIEEIGDCFFSLVNLCRFIPLHPDFIMNKNIIKYLNRCIYIEKELMKEDRSWLSISKSEIFNLWNNAKKHVQNKEDDHAI